MDQITYSDNDAQQAAVLIKQALIKQLTSAKCGQS